MQERSKHYRREGEARVEVLGVRSLRSLGCYKQQSQHVETKRLRNLHLIPYTRSAKRNKLFFKQLIIFKTILKNKIIHQPV